MITSAVELVSGAGDETLIMAQCEMDREAYGDETEQSRLGI